MTKRKTKKISSLTLPKITKNNKPEKIEGFPVSHYSYSSMVRFSTNPILFKIMDINKESFESTRGISSVVGQAFHHGMEVYYGESDEVLVANESEAIEYGLKAAMDYVGKYPDGFISYTKTIPTKQKAQEVVAFAFNEYVKAKSYGKEDVIKVEDEIAEYINIEYKGEILKMPVKLKGYIDKIIRGKDGKLRIIDYKTAYTFTNPEKIDGAKIIQAVEYYLLVTAKYKEAPYSIIFEEIKYTKNADGSPQLREYEMVFEENEQYFDFYFRLYEDMTRAINGEAVFVPNVHALFDNEVALLSYICRLDVDEEQAKLLKKYKVNNITDVLKKEIQNANNMRTLLTAVGSKLTTAKSIDYSKMKNEEKIQTKMLEHGIIIEFVEIKTGPTVDLYLYKPTIGLKMSKLRGYSDDLAQTLGIDGIRVLAPVPGTTYIGFEVPKNKRTFKKNPREALGIYELAIGESYFGKYVIDFRDMPHMLVAGSSGSGKSTLLNSLVKQLLKKKPHVETYLFDPKKVELVEFEEKATLYRDTPGGITVALENLESEMYERYQKMKEAKVKNASDIGLPYKVIIIDEFAELGMKSSIMATIQSLSQLGRAAGFHIIISTQRASAKIISGDIKVNFPTKAVFKMAKEVDSSVMLDQGGAEKLLGKGDMIFQSEKGMIRLQGYTE